MEQHRSIPQHSVLKTKLFAPRPRSTIVPRNRLSGLFDKGDSKKLILVSAAAGFGKSTATANWLRQSGHTYAWLSLDAQDNDPIRFMIHLIATLRLLREDIGNETLINLYGLKLPAIPKVLTPLLNELEDFTDPFFLVLDDYHLIDSKYVHQAIEFLLDHLPPAVTLVLIARVDPPLYFTGLRANAEMIEIREEALRFSPTESAEYFKNMIDIELSRGDLETLDQKMEGWVVGMQLMTFSLVDRPDVSKFISSIDSSTHYLHDYLAREVLNRQTAELRRFLLLTSLVEEFTADLCNALTDSPNGKNHLKDLEARNLFLVPLDDSRQWFRYHHLFRAFLLDQLHGEVADLNDLHIRASRWLGKNGFLFKAIDHALSSENYDLAAELIIQNSRLFLSGYRYLQTQYAVVRWFEQIPEERTLAQPQLAILHAWWLTFGTYLSRAEERLGLLGSKIATISNLRLRKRLEGEVQGVHAYISYMKGNTDDQIRFAHMALDCLEDDDLPPRVLMQALLGHAYRLRGEPFRAKKAYDLVVTESNLRLGANITVPSLGRLIGIEAMRGCLLQAVRVFTLGDRFLEKFGYLDIPPVGVGHIEVGKVYREQNKPAIALYHLEKGIKLCNYWALLTASVVDGYLELAWIKAAEENREGAMDLLHQALSLVRERNMNHLVHLVRSHINRMLLLQDEVGPVLNWAEERKLNPDDEVSFAQETEYLIYARLLLTTNRPDDALFLLDKMEASARIARRTSSVYKINILQCIAYAAKKDRPKLVKKIEPVLEAVESEGYFRIFIDEGMRIKETLQTAASFGVRARVAVRLLDALPKAAHYLLKPLSKREMEVLKSIAARKNNQEIAQSLFIALTTVKRHISNIYNKLNVSERESAIQRAKDLGII